MNTVRKHLSAIKGGRLAVAAAPARVVTLAISDVPGDDLSIIASGPTVPDVSTRADALAVLTKYGIEIPAAVAMHLRDEASETPKPSDPRFANVANRLVARPQKSLEAAAKVAGDAGLSCVILGNAIEGEARDVGTSMPALRGSAEIGVSRSKYPAFLSPAVKRPLRSAAAAAVGAMPNFC
jgi:hydroxypyruvate reductase